MASRGNLGGLARATADVVKALDAGSHEYKLLSKEYEVVTVPKIWVNDKIFIDGAAPTREMMAATFVKMIEQALDKSVPQGKLRLGGD